MIRTLAEWVGLAAVLYGLVLVAQRMTPAFDAIAIGLADLIDWWHPAP